jgi:hypothetical protein
VSFWSVPLLRRWLAMLVLSMAGLGVCVPKAQAQSLPQPPELSNFELFRPEEGGLALSFTTKFELPRSVEEAVRKGTALYFVAEAEVYRSRWYWRDKRLAQVSRSWKLSFQPLTEKFRVSVGGLNQSFDSLQEALSQAQRMTAWTLLEPREWEEGKLYVEFAYRLDTNALPRPLQIGVIGQSDWQIRLERVQRLP